MCFRPNMLGLLLLTAGIAFFISAAICSVWLLLIFGAAFVAAGILFIRKR